MHHSIQHSPPLVSLVRLLESSVHPTGSTRSTSQVEKHLPPQVSCGELKMTQTQTPAPTAVAGLNTADAHILLPFLTFFNPQSAPLLVSVASLWLGSGITPEVSECLVTMYSMGQICCTCWLYHHDWAED